MNRLDLALKDHESRDEKNTKQKYSPRSRAKHRIDQQSAFLSHDAEVFGHDAHVYDVDDPVTVDVCVRIPMRCSRGRLESQSYRGGVDDIHISVLFHVTQR